MKVIHKKVGTFEKEKTWWLPRINFSSQLSSSSSIQCAEKRSVCARERERERERPLLNPKRAASLLKPVRRYFDEKR